MNDFLNDILEPNFIIQTIGLVFIVTGVLLKIGAWKSWYPHSRGGVYGYVPMGLLFILYSFQAQAETWLGKQYFLYIAAFIALFLLAIYVSLRPPQWMKPEWVQWIEKHPARIRKAMKAEMGSNKQWQELVTSEKTVDAWARQLSRKPQS
ncbi:MAG: hypothetical protein RBT34_05425 [Anaerolineaceae bacterium]|jgi:hypothetical protein|nr:hypothetical protein [Anaerolineaceae bacterium]